MIQTVFHTSENNNLYLYDDQSSLSLLLHPELKKASECREESDPYYIKKYEYLKCNGFFKEKPPVVFDSLRESYVKSNILNTRQIVFETTDSCNLKCEYCAQGDIYSGCDEKTDLKMNLHSANRLLKYIFKNKPQNKNNKLIVGFYGGEALLNIGFIKSIVETSKQLNKEKEFDLEFSLTTNGTLLHKYADFLVENRFRLLISLDGNERNHSYRVFGGNGKSSFKKIVENVDKIKKKYPQYFSTHVNFNAVLNDRSTVKDIYEYIFERYDKLPRVAELNTRDVKAESVVHLEKIFKSKWRSEAEFQKEDSDLARLAHDKSSAYSELTNFLKFMSINHYISNINALMPIKEERIPTGTCTPFSKKIFLTCANKLLPCEKINYKYNLGSISDDIDIDIPEITKKYNYYYDRIKQYCKSCYAYKFCGVCLFHISGIEKINDNDFFCDRFENEENFKNRLSRIFSFIENYPIDYSQIIENVIIE